MNCDVKFSSIGISFSFVMKLYDDCLSFEVIGEVKEIKRARIGSLYFMPMLGCTYENQIDGYMLVPDGCGALIRYKPAGSYISAFDKRIYGLDMGIDSLSVASDISASRPNDYLVDEQQVTFPVFGIVHGADQNAIMGTVESGAEYASVYAAPAGFSTNYNWICSRFDYRQKYALTSGSGNVGTTVPMTEMNSMKPKVSFCFLTGKQANYSGIAVRYRENLKDMGLLKEERIDEQIPLCINVVGSDVKKGFIRNLTVSLTSVNEAEKLIEDIEKSSIKNLTFVYSGWQKGGLNGSKYGTTSFEKKVGSEKEFSDLKKIIEQSGGRFYLSVNPVTATKDQISPMLYAALTKSNTYAVFERANTSVMYYQNYVLRSNKAGDFIIGLLNEKNEFQMRFDQLGYRLYSDYTRNYESTRTDMIANIRNIFKQNENRAAITIPNMYLWEFTGEYFDIPLTNSKYMFETDTVPFLQIVLKGSIDCYAPYGNQGSCNEIDALRLIEYGVYPTFMTIADDNYALKDTPLEDYYSLNYYDWKERIISYYKTVNDALSRVEGAYIVSHRVVDEGIVCVCYDNGINIYINYTSEDYGIGQAVVPAKGYFVKGN